MGIANEAGYLYVLSKELNSINSKLKSSSRKAEKYLSKHQRTQKDKHKIKHTKLTIQISNLIRKHNKLVTRIKHHEVAFRYALHKEHQN